jgi:U3 small nucleolar RNA-associated protein 13
MCVCVCSGAADGGVKLWTLKTGECVNTFEEHADKVWSLSAPAQSAGSNSMCVTGGGDSLLNVWEDVTSQEQAAEDEAAAQRVLKEQELSNCVKLKQWFVFFLVFSHSHDFSKFSLVAFFCHLSGHRPCSWQSIWISQDDCWASLKKLSPRYT